MERVRFFYDFVSPYTYLAATQIGKAVPEAEWEPAFLGAIMKATGNQPPATLPARAAYMMHDLPRWAELYGVPFRWSPHFPLPTQHALRAALAVRAAAPDRYLPFVHAAFRAMWEAGENLGERAVIARVAESVGADGALAAAASDDPRWKDALKVSTDAALAAGAFGLPAFVVGDGELYFGNDRIELLQRRLAAGRPTPPLATLISV